MDDKEIQEHLTSLSGWKHHNRALVKEFNFNNFMESMAFANKIAPIAEEMGHHPDLQIEYSKVTVTLSTHDGGPAATWGGEKTRGGVTPKDLDLALKIDEVS